MNAASKSNVTGIEFRQVSKRYGEGDAPLVVKGIDFVVPKGTLTTLLGPSGCGKTTTLRMIAGLETVSGGHIFIDGQEVTNLGPTERNVSMVFQSYALFPHMSVIDNVRYGLKVSGVSIVEATERAHFALENVGLKDFDNRLPSELSGGQQQRVAVARALVLEPSVLQRIETGRKVSIEREIFPLIVADGRLFAMATDDYWIDTGRPEPYRRANLDMIDGVRRRMSAPGVENGADVQPTALIEHSLVSSGAVVAPGASVQDSVILAGAIVHEGALVRDSIVMGTVGARARIIDTVVGVAGVIPEGATLEHAFVPDPTAV